MIKLVRLLNGDFVAADTIGLLARAGKQQPYGLVYSVVSKTGIDLGTVAEDSSVFEGACQIVPAAPNWSAVLYADVKAEEFWSCRYDVAAWIFRDEEIWPVSGMGSLVDEHCLLIVEPSGRCFEVGSQEWDNLALALIDKEKIWGACREARQTDA